MANKGNRYWPERGRAGRALEVALHTMHPHARSSPSGHKRETVSREPWKRTLVLPG